MLTWRRALGVSALGAMVAAAACLPGSGPPLNPYVDDAGAPPPTNLGDDAGSFVDVDLGDPFAVTGLQPSHGPWTGGTRTTIAGRGFSSKIEVFIGATQLASSDVFASDPTRASVVTPPGAPGPVDVRLRNPSTAQERTLPAGFFYDSFAVTPGGGASSGGTRISLQGSGTSWTSGSAVKVGGKACTGLTFVDATHLTCSTPPSSAGSQDVAVANTDGSVDQARDAFVYSDSPDGYRGGLYGGALSGNLKVLAFDAWTGAPLVGGTAIAGTNLGTAIVGTFDAAGAVQLSDPSLTGKVTVTAAAKCHQPKTYVDVPVDTVTAYLIPSLDTTCQGDPSSSGNYVPQDYGEIDGELVWQGGIEFQRAPWSNVPKAGAQERQAAYVWTATSSPLYGLGTPDPSTATTPSSGGQLGYAYTRSSIPGNQTVYALAGLEQLDAAGKPTRFEPYAMGVVKGVPVQPNVKTIGVDIPMTTLLDHVVTTVPQPPPTTPRGPDRLVSVLAVNVGANAFAILPHAATTNLLPIPGGVPFVGVPALDGTLAGASYDLSASATSGTGQQDPTSIVTRIETTDANDPVTVGGFFAIPKLLQPSATTWNGTHVQLQASGPIDVVVINISSGDGLVAWSIVSPGTNLSFDLPDLSQVSGVGRLVHGGITVSFAIARMNNFDYGTLRSGQLVNTAWNAYAEDTAHGTY